MRSRDYKHLFHNGPASFAVSSSSSRINRAFSTNESPSHLAKSSSQWVSRVAKPGDGLLHRARVAGLSEDGIQVLGGWKSASPLAHCVVILDVVE